MGWRGAMANKAFLFWIALIALVLFCLPVTSMTPLVAQASVSAAPVVMVGNSVIRHASKCDADRRSIPAMLAAASGTAVFDLSFSGQTLSQGVNLAAVSLRNPRVRTVLLPISLFALTEQDMLSLRDYAAFRLLNPALPTEGIRHRLFARDDQTGLYGPMQKPFSFDGTAYPAYDELKARFFLPERQATRCPEGDGLNRDFVTAMYDHNYAGFPLQPASIALVASLGREAQERGKDLLVVLMPIDAELLQSLRSADVSVVEARVQDARRQLAQAGVKLVDLSAAVPNAGFADRWCACGHLSEQGRQTIAARLRDWLARPIATASVPG